MYVSSPAIAQMRPVRVVRLGKTVVDSSKPMLGNKCSVLTFTLTETITDAEIAILLDRYISGQVTDTATELLPNGNTLLTLVFGNLGSSNNTELDDDAMSRIQRAHECLLDALGNG